jgi:hypothetical protein
MTLDCPSAFTGAIPAGDTKVITSIDLAPPPPIVISRGSAVTVVS